MSSPTQRSLDALRKAGWLCAIVEKWNGHIKRRQDLFGFADILAIKGDECRLIQTTSGPNVAARVTKIESTPAAAIWLQARSRTIHVHGWRKVGVGGKRKLWECRVVEIKPTPNGFLAYFDSLNFQRPPEAETPGQQSA